MICLNKNCKLVGMIIQKIFLNYITIIILIVSQKVNWYIIYKYFIEYYILSNIDH